MTDPVDLKIVIAGAMGVGKTTAIAAVSETPPVSTEVRNNDTAAHEKAFTTVAMDYGELRSPDGNRLRLYGVPGQTRFSFMWPMIERGALGVMLLADDSREQAFEELVPFLKAFAYSIGAGRAVLGVGHLAGADAQVVDRYVARLSAMQIAIPVFTVDVRRRNDVLLLIDALFTQVETAEEDIHP